MIISEDARSDVCDGPRMIRSDNHEHCVLFSWYLWKCVSPVQVSWPEKVELHYSQSDPALHHLHHHHLCYYRALRIHMNYEYSTFITFGSQEMIHRPKKSITLPTFSQTRFKRWCAHMEQWESLLSLFCIICFLYQAGASHFSRVVKGLGTFWRKQHNVQKTDVQ